ncbi:MAG: cobyric acid synthase [Nitrospirae bacterium]|nr:cobyric acid synthase [Nitrospirota bacterium]
MAKALMIQGTGSGAGKSLITASLCRIFKDEGINVAPFKAQNMALNSYITAEGAEIGRAQALQAEAARIEPAADMNPVLLKASGEMGSQVIIHGKVHSTMKAQEYYAFKKTAWSAVKESFDRLSQRHDLIIMEGAGSPAEINLMDVDIVNMSAAKYAKAPVILVGDIDKGGVFASIYGTVKLLGRSSRHIKGFVINKFRGDAEILKPGLDMIRDKTGKPVIGVLPYIKEIGLPEEDGLSLQKISNFKFQISNYEKIKVVIVRLQYIANFTDFDPFAYEPDVELIYSSNPADMENADIVIVPGSKNTVKDLILLKEAGLDESIKRAYSKGVRVIGMCGGYQMLGKKIYDPHCVESRHKEIDGIGLLNIETVFDKTKVTSQVEAEIVQSSEFGVMSLKKTELEGYEIHMGQSTGDIGLFRLKRRRGEGENRRGSVTGSPVHRFADSEVLDGSMNGNCWGTYIHGIFDNDTFRRGIINHERRKRNLPQVELGINYTAIKDKAINNLADIVKANIDMDFIKRTIRL